MEFNFDDFLKEAGLSHLGPHIKDSSAEPSSNAPSDPITIEHIRHEFLKAIKKNKELEETVARLAARPIAHAPVLLADDDLTKQNRPVLVVYEGRVLEVSAPNGMTIVSGDVVKISSKTMQIIDRAENPGIGDAATVKRVIDTLLCEIDFAGRTRVVANGKFANQLEDGDRVLVDGTGSVILSKLSLEGERYRFTEETNIAWDDIGGLEKTKSSLIEAIELPHRRRDLFEFYNKKPPKGILLYGPPGCGKTMLAKAAATGLSAIHKELGAAPVFFSIKGPEILDRYVGVAEATVRSIFAAARNAAKKLGYTVIIFIDECDAILYKRGTGRSSDIERTIVPAFLSEMDGLDTGNVLVLLATNRPDVLDSAVVRPGRVDDKIEVERPDKNAACEIFKINFRKTKLHGEITPEEMAEFAAGEFLSEKYGLCEFVLGGSRKGEAKRFTLAHIANGAMIKGVVDKATSSALQRDLKHKDAPIPEERGVRKRDITDACKKTLEENLGLNFDEELAHFTKNYLKDVEDILEIRELRQTVV